MKNLLSIALALVLSAFVVNAASANTEAKKEAKVARLEKKAKHKKEKAEKLEKQAAKLEEKAAEVKKSETPAAPTENK